MHFARHMGPRRRLRIISRLRHTTLLRTVALFLVVLTLAPFSAPFKTFDLAGYCGDACCPNDKLDSDDALIADLAVNSLPLPAAHVRNVPVVPAANRALRFPPLVLRL